MFATHPVGVQLVVPYGLHPQQMAKFFLVGAVSIPTMLVLALDCAISRRSTSL